MKQAIIFGAGNIGRGFIGQLLSESGYMVNFVDVDPTLLAALNRRGRYTIRLVADERSDEVQVGPVRALSAQDRAAVVQAVAEADIGATAVGANALQHIAPNVATGIVRRAEQGNESPLNLIICENLKDAAQIFRRLIREALPPAYHDFLARRIGLVDTVIARMVPPLTPELRQQDPSLIIVEPYKELPVDAAAFIGAPPPVVGMQPVSPFAFYTERKLYLHNAGHAVLGYLGHRQGYRYAYEALADPAVASAVQGAMAESVQALARKYGHPTGQLAASAADLFHRFGNRALGDTNFRLARDPVRKLARTDRLTGAALTALAQGVQPVYLVQGIVAALRFDHPDDPVALQLQENLRTEGLDVVLQKVCGLEPEEPLALLIKENY